MDETSISEVRLSVTSDDGIVLPAILSLPVSAPLIGGLVPLHPADDASREQFLFCHLADLLPRHGIAVLRFDRRPTADGRDVPLALQAQDALAALQTLRHQARSATGIEETMPVGLWGFSQGAWAAPLAASLSADVAFLALVASTGVSPARQMRYGTAEQLRRAGHDQEALEELALLRSAYEDYLRGQADRAYTQTIVERLAGRPWFPLAYVPANLPPPGSWQDMDFDPSAIFSRVHCPALLFYGEDDEWTPVEESEDAWRRATSAAGNKEVTLVRLPGTSHHPTLRGGREVSSISPLYTGTLLTWLENHIRRKR
jgi:pimeloyl-ACP methyl ester carboxylesterase